MGDLAFVLHFWLVFGAILMKISLEQNLEYYDFILQSITFTMFLASILVLIGTKGKHPGWIVLLLIGILLILGSW